MSSAAQTRPKGMTEDASNYLFDFSKIKHCHTRSLFSKKMVDETFLILFGKKKKTFQYDLTQLPIKHYQCHTKDTFGETLLQDWYA